MMTAMIALARVGKVAKREQRAQVVAPGGTLKPVGKPRTSFNSTTVTALTTASDIELCKQHRAGKAALDDLVRRHGGLARTWAKRFSREEQCCSQDDLFQECQRGLMDAAGHFDPERGAFSTVAVIWMKKRCLAFIEKAKQFGAQSDGLGEVVEGDTCGRDYSYLAEHFGVIEKLYNLGLISLLDLEIMRAVCSPLDVQEEVLKPLVATWWRGAKKNTLGRVARAMESVRSGRVQGGGGGDDGAQDGAQDAQEAQEAAQGRAQGARAEMRKIPARLEIQQEMW